MSLWQASEERKNSSLMNQYLQKITKDHRIADQYANLHQWSVENSEIFWKSLFDFFPIKYEGSLDKVTSKDHSFLNYGWFPEARLNFAENLLAQGQDTNIALELIHESGLNQKINYQELRHQVASLASEIAPHLGDQDVLACYMPNIAETVISMLASSSLGAIFTSTSCDFGVQGVVDRLGQSRPKVLVTVAGYQYNDKYIDLSERVNEVLSQVDSIEKVIVVDFLGMGHSIKNAIEWSQVLKREGELQFKKVSFGHPLYIMYSSGTTGKPKCIVHSVGGTLLQHVKELGLHTDLTEDKSIMYFTTCGWMMWNWLVSSLFFGSRVVLYEGSPGHPDLTSFMEKVDKHEINIFGTSPKFLKALEDSAYDGRFSFDSLETILSTGAPLMPEQFDFVYHKIKKDVQLSSISGGTDIIGCFMLGNPLLPVERGEIQCPGLGMDVSCFNSEGREVIGEEGELVCLKPFISAPIYFLNDPEKKRFSSAYFEKFPGVWCHGDFISLTEKKSVVVFGRSDATLNPGGVRIGTAEIYRQTEKIPFLEDSICVGKKKDDGDVEVWLFVVLSEGTLTPERIKLIKKSIKENTTPRHVPKRVFAVQGIPYTRSGKKVELAVSNLINGREVNNKEAISNPEVLESFKL